MTRHDDMVRLRHMLDYSVEAVHMLSGKDRKALSRERMLELALVRLIEIIGEAAAKITPETKSQYPLIPWNALTGMRNRLIHGYDSIDLNILWDTIEVDLPPLISELETILTK